MRRLSVAISVLVAVLIPGAALSDAGAADRAQRYVAGAAGLGDPYYPLYGNGGYDVKNYALSVSYDPETDNLAGIATISALTTENLFRFNLDLQGMTVRSVDVDGDAASWVRSDDHELVVTPRHKLRSGTGFSTVVRYDGVPRTQLLTGTDLESGFMHTDDGAIVAGAPEVAANWFPVNDHPLDKATYTFVVTVPAGLSVIANGRLIHHSKADATGGTSTWTWRASEPMSPYLASINIGKFDLRSYRTTGGLRMFDAIDPDLYHEGVNPADPASETIGAVAEASLRNQPKIIDFLSSIFGRYPFSTGGGVVDDYDQLFFAMENQTRPVYPKYFFTDTVSGDSVVVHEVAHQWYGDSVAVAQWKDVWLNEGFATYAEWLWNSHQGEATEQEFFDFFYNFFPADDPFWTTIVADPGVEHLFDNPSYFRGAMTLHALRLDIGDPAFFRLLRAWAGAKAGGNGTTEQFIALAERVSGRDLSSLFHAWLYSAARPELSVGMAANRLTDAAVPPPAAAIAELARYGR